MVRDLERVQKSSKFPESAPAGEAVFYRTYSRRQSTGRESWQQVGDRILEGLVSLGKLTPSQAALTAKMQQQLKSLSSGRWLWVGGTQWLEKPENFSGAYNCTSTNVVDWRAFGLMMDLAMMGCGTGAVLEPKYINQLPAIRNRLSVELQGKIGTTPAAIRREQTEININNNIVTIYVGDSRAGWVKSYQTLLELSSDERFTGDVIVRVVLDDIRGEGERLQGFGGVANPVKLPTLYDRCASILNKALGRQLNSVECCLLIDEAAVVVVAGNVRRCLPGEALVHTESGLVPIQKIRIGDRVLTSKGFYPVTNFFDQGTQSLCRIKTQNGYFECTPDHKVAVLSDVYGNYQMVKAKNLTEGDRLIFVPKSIPGTATELPEFRQADSKAKPITIPALTTDVAYFLGYLHGDGSVAADGSRVRFRIAEHQPEIITRLVGVAQSFGLDTYTLRTPEQCKAKAFELQLNSSNLNRYLAQFKKSFTSISIPDCILLGTLDIRKAYLAGLADADGCHSQGILVASVHQDFLRQVQAVYASLGITTRQCSSVGKKELVAVGHDAYESTLALLSKYSGYFSTTEIDRLKSSEDRRFSKVMVRSNVTDLTPIKVKSVEMDVRTSHTYDIEVSTIHEFVCEGILVSNSAGMRQGVSEDELFANAKGNLWHQDEHGNWRIDPERDALRMANHTRVFHRKPSLDECINAVRQQYYSGEGAIQWAGEAIARANADIVNTLELKKDFLKTYTNSETAAADWLLNRVPEMPATEVEHRLSRYALNPCVTSDTWIHTEKGARQVKDLIGVQHGTYVNGELFSTTSSGFFFTGVKPVVKLTTKEGYSLRLTENHQLLKVTAQTQNSQYTEWVEAGKLQIGDRISIHNHRELLPWDGKGTKDEGWLLGNLVGDGCFSHNPSNYSYQAHLRYWGDSQVEMKEYALGLIRKSVQSSNKLQGVYSKQHKYYQVSSAGLAGLARDYGIAIRHKTITPEIEQASFDFYCGFLQGIFDADGSVQGTQNSGKSVGRVSLHRAFQEKGVSIRLAQSNLPLLEAVQRMLLRLGIASSIYQNRRLEGVTMLPDSNRELAEYFCKAQHELVIANDNIVSFQKLIGFAEPKKAERLQSWLSGYKRNINRERFSVTISSIESDGQEAVYDCTVPGVARFDANGLVAHNCGEILGTNFHCVSGETQLITRDSIHKIKDVVGEQIEIWNGKRWSKVVPFQTNTGQKLYRVSFADGSYLDATEYHRFFVKDRFGKEYKEVQTKDLLNCSKYSIHTEPFTIDYLDGVAVDSSYAYTLGVAVGDGTIDSNGNAKIRLYQQKAELLVAGKKSPQRSYSYLPTFVDVTDLGFSGELLQRLKNDPDSLNAIACWHKKAILAFIAGLADTDGSNTDSNGIRIYVSDYQRAYRLQLLLSKCAIRSSVNIMARQASTTNLGQRAKDLYYLQITDCAEIPCQRLDTTKGHKPTNKGKWQIIKSVEELPGQHDTYCFNEPEFNKGVFGNTLTGNCNLAEIHLNQIDPHNYQEQKDAFTAGALSVASLLNHQFIEERYQSSRELDPIVGVSFTGLFDFFVNAFGTDWLRWWEAGRPQTKAGLEFKQQEEAYLSRWKAIVNEVVWQYCDEHNFKRPNRCTTVQPSGTKSLLTGASPGWHPPKAQRFIRRITFRKNDPVALACIDYGYNIVPSQSDKDENGNLLNNPFDDRCTEWLVEIPVAVPWADFPGADEIEISQFSAAAQMDFYMQVQKHYVAHNTSATIELREHEIESLGTRIYEAIRDDEGYISAALLARFDAHQTFPRLPFEPITKETYDQLMQEVKSRRQTDDFYAALSRYDSGEMTEAGPAGCDSDKCLFAAEEPK
ncbi:ribonucleoside-triphosphate reductase, adenosylcobalamin-dependent [Chlorogloea sp. CCALA 695]|uniref:ribonucleoside-triphosphate reductase, adenosylcobalamin-dependent n=1 Tax=Chlorogloea sp. CCALA 695 TaxID=2107693 RepID=UPI0018EB277F|nr:ribonucleoside-triphosphate reductase, adenosylcobalamin-dependent [Chlorogloea sp. CCALA 695]